MSNFKVGDRVRITGYRNSDENLIYCNAVKVGGTAVVLRTDAHKEQKFNTYIRMDGKKGRDEWYWCDLDLELAEGDEVTSVICDHDTLRATCKTCNAGGTKKSKTSVIEMDWSQDPDELDDVDELRDLVRSCQERIETLEEENDTDKLYDDINEADDLIYEALNSLKEAKAKLQAHL